MKEFCFKLDVNCATRNEVYFLFPSNRLFRPRVGQLINRLPISTRQILCCFRVPSPEPGVEELESNSSLAFISGGHFVLQLQAEDGGDAAVRPATAQLARQPDPRGHTAEGLLLRVPWRPQGTAPFSSGQLCQDRRRHVRGAVVTFLCHGMSSSVRAAWCR